MEVDIELGLRDNNDNNSSSNSHNSNVNVINNNNDETAPHPLQKRWSLNPCQFIISLATGLFLFISFCFQIRYETWCNSQNNCQINPAFYWLCALAVAITIYCNTLRFIVNVSRNTCFHCYGVILILFGTFAGGFLLIVALWQVIAYYSPPGAPESTSSTLPPPYYPSSTATSTKIYNSASQETFVAFMFFCWYIYIIGIFASIWRCGLSFMDQNSVAVISSASVEQQHQEEESKVWEEKTEQWKRKIIAENWPKYLKSKEDDQSESKTCFICMYDSGDSPLIFIPECIHTFHIHCIAKWFARNLNPTCPICRSPIA